MACSEFLYLQRQRGRDHTIAASIHMRLSGSSEQTSDPAVFVHVDLLGSGNLGQTRHDHDLARQGNDEARTGADLQAAHGDGKILGRAQQSGIIRQGVLSLCHAHRQITEAELCEPLCLLLGSGGQHGLRAAVDALHDGVELVDKRRVGADFGRAMHCVLARVGAETGAYNGFVKFKM